MPDRGLTEGDACATCGTPLYWHVADIPFTDGDTRDVLGCENGCDQVEPPEENDEDA